jgi:hypothetical protein
MILICIEYVLEKKSSLSHHIMKEKKIKKEYTHLFSPTTPSHTTKEEFLGKQKKPQPSYLEKQPLGIVPIPPKKSPLQIPPKKLLWKGVELPCPPLLTQKKPFWKRKIKF